LDYDVDHVYFMQRALDLARQALDQDEFPVGCIVVHDGSVIAHGVRTNTRGEPCPASWTTRK
jgi:tRNA(adenine34) deaminase